ncbi:ribonuclease H-like domain-containing protein [Candidatus Woesearchaeota archaeon]|nr:ribonuclease H-like domain-containing protein [Candidatus Woesearchaeota archaeon]
MIRRSFIFLDKVSGKSEQNIWYHGVFDWKSFIDSGKIKGFSNKRKRFYDRKLKEAQSALYNFNSSYFVGKLPSTETWRLYEFFKSEVLFLDIEIANRQGDINVIGLFDGLDTNVMVHGFNLDLRLLKRELKKYKLIVTFNGSVFDIPVMKRYFSDIIPKIPHIDLRFLSAKLGLKGSLKDIEPIVGIKRPRHLKGSPVDLWRAYHASGDKEYLDLLVQYNEEDIMNLKPLMEYCYKKMKDECLGKG